MYLPILTCYIHTAASGSATLPTIRITVESDGSGQFEIYLINCYLSQPCSGANDDRGVLW